MRYAEWRMWGSAVRMRRLTEVCGLRICTSIVVDSLICSECSECSALAENTPLTTCAILNEVASSHPCQKPNLFTADVGKSRERGMQTTTLNRIEQIHRHYEKDHKIKAEMQRQLP